MSYRKLGSSFVFALMGVLALPCAVSELRPFIHDRLGIARADSNHVNDWSRSVAPYETQGAERICATVFASKPGARVKIGLGYYYNGEFWGLQPRDVVVSTDSTAHGGFISTAVDFPSAGMTQVRPVVLETEPGVVVGLRLWRVMRPDGKRVVAHFAK